MTSNRLKFNTDNTNIILLRSCLQLKTIKRRIVHLNGVVISVYTTALCLRVLNVSELTIAAFIKRFTAFIMFVNFPISVGSRNRGHKTLVYAFVISRVDYSNSIFGSARGVYLSPLQSVVNAAVRLRPKHDHMTDSLRD